MSRVAENRAELRRQAHQARIRSWAFAIVTIGVLGLGAFFAFGDFFSRPSGGGGESIEVQSSMAGFTPADIRVTAGTTAVFDWWTQDAAIHLEDGVHTMIAPELGLNESLPAEGRRTVVWQVPDQPGTYDVYCDSCCGGKDSPTMHGRIVIEAA